ncbi:MULTISPECIES: cytochrome c oxidase assembly protein [Sphingomonas]|uniref:cytochrome c oxidase assembly protein n=1 Tax=Sphingomonas TaxID=13687 RepID=UPI000DEFE1CB|nr:MULTISPECIES: cytochrome c oxidase assembly protein [Sphingomonas]
MSAALEDWTIEPLAAFLLGMSLSLYSTGRWRMSDPQRRAAAPPWRAGCYYAAAATMVVALFSPLDELADRSFAWHMTQHLLLMLAAAPLLALGNTHLVSLFAFPLRLRRLLGLQLTRLPGVRRASSDRRSPLVATMLFAAGLWLWHAPRMYDAALDDAALHTLEHLTFLVTSAVFWRMVLHAGDRRLDAGTAVLLSVVAGFQANLLAALIVLAPDPIYSAYSLNDPSDQQIGGLLMLVPASLVFLAATVHSIFRLLRSNQRPRSRPAAAAPKAQPKLASLRSN